ncbi:MAG: hypothetical protein V1661_00515 [bacterium]
MTKKGSLKKQNVRIVELSGVEKTRFLQECEKKLINDLGKKIKELREKKKGIEAEIKEAQRVKKELCKKNKK